MSRWRFQNARLRQTEAALRDDEERFRSLYAIVGQVTYRPRWGTPSVNRAICDMIGYDEGALLGMNTLAITHPDEREGAPNMVGVWSPENCPTTTVRSASCVGHGPVVHTLVSSAAVRDATGVPKYMIALVQDISERKQIRGRAGRERGAPPFGDCRARRGRGVAPSRLERRDRQRQCRTIARPDARAGSRAGPVPDRLGA